MENSIVSNEGRAKALIYSIYGIIAVEVLYIVFFLMELYILNELSNETEVSLSILNFSENFASTVDTLHSLITIISSLLFVSWISRAYSNLHLKAEYLNSSEKWAIWLWFIPVVNIYSSRKLVNEIFEETSTLLTKYKIKHSIDLSTQLVTYWWVLLIVNFVSFKIIEKVYANSFSIEESIEATMVYLASSVISILAAYYAYKLVKTYSSAEVLLNQVPDFDEGSDESQDGTREIPAGLEPS